MPRFKGRREDVRFLTGHGRYSADCDAPDALHAFFLRSDRSHAVIRSVGVSGALRAPGVRLVLTGADIADAGFRTLQPLVHYPGRGGIRLRLPKRLPLAFGRARFVGEPIALVLADSLQQAMDAGELIAVDYEDLPPVIGVTGALEAPAIHENIPGNVCFDFEYGDEAATEAAFARAAHAVKVCVESPRVAPTPMEPRAVLARWEGEKQRYAICCPHQGAFAMRDSLAAMLGAEANKVRVESVDVGGAFGARTAPYYEYVALLHAARLAERPVKWVSSRSDDFANDGHGRAVRLEGELAIDPEGHFLALRTRWLADSGAYLSQAGALTNTGNNRTIGAGPYRVEALYSRHLQVLTNTAPTEAYRGAGRPEAAFVVERLVEEAAVMLGVDAMELRRRNALPREAMPCPSASGTVYDSADFPALVEAAARTSDWKGFAARRSASEKKGRLRGLGCALFIEPSGGGGVPKDQVALRFAGEGKELRIELFMVAGSSGQGHETVFPELIAQWLGFDPQLVVLRAGDPDGPAVSGAPSIGSRTALSQGGAFRNASDEAIRKGLELAAEALEAPASDLEFLAGRYRVKGTDRDIAFSELARRHARAGRAHPLDSEGSNPANRAFPSGAHVCEVEIDPDTGETEVLSYTAVDDIGRPLNPVLAEAQIVGGVVQSAGHVFGEHCRYDEESGQLLNGSFMDYPMPRADRVHEWRLSELPVPSPANPLGAKGAGEAGTTGGLPACSNAVADALRSAGVRAFDLPATPERVWRALRAR